jgi:hypothetical protein
MVRGSVIGSQEGLEEVKVDISDDLTFVKCTDGINSQLKGMALMLE